MAPDEAHHRVRCPWEIAFHQAVHAVVRADVLQLQMHDRNQRRGACCRHGVGRAEHRACDHSPSVYIRECTLAQLGPREAPMPRTAVEKMQTQGLPLCQQSSASGDGARAPEARPTLCTHSKVANKIVRLRPPRAGRMQMILRQQHSLLTPSRLQSVSQQPKGVGQAPPAQVL